MKETSDGCLFEIKPKTEITRITSLGGRLRRSAHQPFGSILSLRSPLRQRRQAQRWTTFSSDL